MSENQVKLTPTPHFVVRVLYEKTGNMQYVSQLDLLRTMQRILLRADIPVWHSEGFNPQPKISFGVPLSVGCESLCELMDVHLCAPLTPEEIKDRLNRAFPEGMKVRDAYLPETKFADVAYMRYEIRVKSALVSTEKAEEVKALLGTHLTIRKTSKSGEEREVDLHDKIFDASVTVENDELVLYVTLPANSTDYVNPDQLVRALSGATALLTGDLVREHYSILRHEAYCADRVTVFR